MLKQSFIYVKAIIHLICMNVLLNLELITSSPLNKIMTKKVNDNCYIELVHLLSKNVS